MEFFDLEWAILNTLNIVKPQTPTAAIVHDCQLLNDPLDPEIFDTLPLLSRSSRCQMPRNRYVELFGSV